MTIEVRIVAFRAEELPKRLGLVEKSTLAESLAARETGSFVLGAELIAGDSVSLLDWCQSRDPMVPGNPALYHEWHNNQRSVNFWQAAFSWNLYWNVICDGPNGHINWPFFIEQPLRPPPFLGFLDISCGYALWDFQFELMYRLADNDRSAGRQFRMDWMAGRLEAEQKAAELLMPDGETLLDAIKSFGPPGDWKRVQAVPVHAAKRLLKIADSVPSSLT